MTTETEQTFNELMRERREARRAEKAAAKQTTVAASPDPRLRRGKRKPKPLRRVDLLASIEALAARPPRLVAMTRSLPPSRTSARDGTPDGIFQSKGRPAVRGPAAIVRRFEEKLGVQFTLGPDGGLIALTPAGQMTDALAAALDILAPLLAPYLGGSPLPCAWDCEAEAVTLLAPGKTPACAVHAELPDAEPPVQYTRVGMDPTTMARQVAARLRGN